MLNEESDDERKEDRDLDNCCSGDFGDGIGRCLLDSTKARGSKGSRPAAGRGSEQTVAIVGRPDHRDQRSGKRPRSIRFFRLFQLDLANRPSASSARSAAIPAQGLQTLGLGRFYLGQKLRRPHDPASSGDDSGVAH